jgi:phage baseplate assembly protein W
LTCKIQVNPFILQSNTNQAVLDVQTTSQPFHIIIKYQPGRTGRANYKSALHVLIKYQLNRTRRANYKSALYIIINYQPGRASEYKSILYKISVGLREN